MLNIETFKAVADLLVPARCICCGRVLLRAERHICLGCLADMPLTYFWLSGHNKMADSFNALIQDSLSVDAPYEPYTRALSLFYYQDDYEHITKAVKYGGNSAAGRFFGRMLGHRLTEAMTSCGFPPISVVAPVPLHWRRHLKRGYNQAQVIASGVAETLCVPLRADILRKVRSTVSQTSLDHWDRLANVASAFRASSSVLETLLGQPAVHILLVDDVFTTGATLFSCRKAILEAIENLSASALKPHFREIVISVATLAYASRSC